MRKKILFRIRSMEMGGVAKVTLDIIKHINPEEFETHLLITIGQGELIDKIPEGIHVIILTKGKQYMSDNKIIRFFQLAVRYMKIQMYYRFPGLLKRKIRFIPDIEVAAMHSSLAGLVNSPFKQSKKINWFHSDLSHHPLKFGRSIAGMMNRCDVTVFVSENTHKNVEEFTGIRIPKAVIIRNAFDLENIITKAEEKIEDPAERMIMNRTSLFVSIGRLCYQKGYDLLLDAHIELIKAGIKHHIAIIGGGPDYLTLKEKIRLFKVENTFFLLGMKENPYPYIKAADFYIQPSRYEAYPLAVGEALILNKPVISTDEGGIRGMIRHRETGIITGTDPENLMAAMIEILNNKALILHIRERQQEIDFNRHNADVRKCLSRLFKF